MRLFLYYALHSFVNQLRKLFKTWVLIFLLACMLIGGLIGLGAAKLSDAAEQNQEAAQTETLEENGEEPAETPDEDRLALVELIAGAVILGILVYEVLSADKNGSKIFLPADVNLLFPSPMRPQSVLLFRLATQLGAAFAASIYLLFQIPSLVLNVGLSVWAALAMILVWCLTIAMGKLVQVALYLACAEHPGLKRHLRTAVYALLALAGAGFVLFWRRGGGSPLEAAKLFFNAPLTRCIPVWGWLKGLCAFAAEGSVGGFLLCLFLTVLGGAVLLRLIRRSRADFYEDAMAKSEETAELLARAASEKSSGVVFSKRKKDRGDGIRRDGMTRGYGAWVFFHKSLYNRFRFAHLHFFTKTMETYLAAGVGAALLCRLVFRTESLLPVVLSLAGLAFFRALGNPLEQDTKMDFFRLIPESAAKKLFASLLGGTVNCLLDLLPGLVLGTLILGGNVLAALCWIPFILSIDVYATCVGAFIDLSVPIASGKTIKQIIQVMFVYFGLLPDIAVMAVGIVTGHTVPAALIAAAVNLALGGVFFALCPSFLEPGNRPADRERGGPSVDIKIVRHHFSRIGTAAFLVLAVASALQIGLIRLLPPWGEIPDWALFAVTFAPLYLVSFPLGWLVLRKLPAQRGETGSLSLGQLVPIVLIAIFLMYLGNLMGAGINAMLDSFLGVSDGNPISSYALADSLLAKVLFLVILAPVWEEFFFRRLLIDRIRPYGERLAVVTSALMFGLFHGNLSQFFYAALLGGLFGYVYLRTGKLRYSLGLHMLINLLGSVLAPALLEISDTAVNVYSMAMMLLALAGLACLILRRRSVRFAPAERELPGRQRFSAVWLNPGMLLFLAACLGTVAFTLAGAAGAAH